MSDLSLSVQVDLAQVLGLLAVVVSLVLGRAAELRDALGWALQHVSLLRGRARHVLPRPAKVVAVARVLHLAFEASAFVCCAAIIVVAFHYFQRVELLTNPFRHVDEGLFERLWADAEGAKDGVLRLTVWVVGLFAAAGGSAWVASRAEGRVASTPSGGLREMVRTAPQVALAAEETGALERGGEPAAVAARLPDGVAESAEADGGRRG